MYFEHPIKYFIKIVPAFVLQCYETFWKLTGRARNLSWGHVKSQCLQKSNFLNVLKLMILSRAALMLGKNVFDLDPETNGFLTAKANSCASIISLLAPLQYLIQVNISSLFEMVFSFGPCDVLLSWFSSTNMFTDYSLPSSSLVSPPPISHIPVLVSYHFFLS